eukprot:14404-Heterococcus_DN1.PRE.3
MRARERPQMRGDSRDGGYNGQQQGPEGMRENPQFEPSFNRHGSHSAPAPVYYGKGMGGGYDPSMPPPIPPHMMAHQHGHYRGPGVGGPMNGGGVPGMPRTASITTLALEDA